MTKPTVISYYVRKGRPFVKGGFNLATFSNQASLTYEGNTVNSNTVTGEILEVLSAEKTAVVSEYGSTDRVAFIVSLVNTGTGDFTGLTLNDDLGSYNVEAGTAVPLSYVDGSIKYFVNGDLQSAPAVTAGTDLLITGISVPAGGSSIIVYEADINEFAPPNATGSITNTVTVSGGGLSEVITASETITAENGADLSITKSLSPQTVPENGEITYTLVIQNTGNQATTSNVSVTDTFDPILSDISVTYNNTPWTEPANYSYNEATGEFATAPNAVTVPAATYTQEPTTGLWTVTPGTAVITVTGTV